MEQGVETRVGARATPKAGPWTRRLREWATLAVLLVSVGGCRPALGQMYKPPSQRAVQVKVLHGVLLAEGGIVAGSGAGVSGLFVVDTAATTTIVSPQTARALGGKGAPGETLTGTTLKLAGAEVSHRPVLVYSLDGFATLTGQTVIGIAGSDIFENFGARIDYLHQLLTLVVLQSCAVPDERVHLKVINGLPFVEATVETASGSRVKGNFLVDTGQAGPGVVFTSEFLKAHPEIEGRPGQPAHGRGGSSLAEGLRVPGLLIGGHALKDVPATVAPPSLKGVRAELAGAIGGGILGRFDVTIDLPGSWLMLTPNEHFADPFGAEGESSVKGK